MDSNSLYYSLELVAGSGSTLNVEQRTALQTSLVILKKNYKFRRVLFWGKILGLKEDYFIAQGRGEDEMQDKKTLYSFNCMDWLLLPPATDSMIEEVSKSAKGRFVGDPSYVYEHFEIRRQGGRDDALQKEEIKVNEESRLAVTVHQIDKEASVVPRGAFIKSPHGLVQVNRSFGEAGKLDNFFHFSEAKNLKKKSILEMSDLNPAIDFLDVLSDDIPKGSWSLQLECASRVLVLRSLLWLGLTFYHVPMTPQHGYIYIGDGTKNLDLPFML
ncbi:radial spoke head protein 9 homolog isoform X2 [Cottoperca gobio]|uniref:Radial spoke head protein 9 homolog n=1 Tax=Cottoperca gobio TaxID=56716 RepID=A0A6J2P8D5_COTGO|nr:radial spoke head protein 9 homolog isoform X2 [Cottoperca gobio]